MALIRHGRERAEQEILLYLARETLVQVLSEEDVHAMGKTYGEELIEEGGAIGVAEGQAEGEARGKAKGRAEGLIGGKRQALLAFLRVRFGARTESFQTRVLALGDMACLDDLLRQTAQDPRRSALHSRQTAGQIRRSAGDLRERTGVSHRPAGLPLDTDPIPILRMESPFGESPPSMPSAPPDRRSPLPAPNPRMAAWIGEFTGEFLRYHLRRRALPRGVSAAL